MGSPSCEALFSCTSFCLMKCDAKSKLCSRHTLVHVYNKEFEVCSKLALSCKSFVLYYSIKCQLSPLYLWYGYFALTDSHANLIYLLCVAITTFTNCQKSQGNGNMNCVYILPLRHSLRYYFNRVQDFI